ncbi:MAG TPA: DUF2934 domain-containing protein [Thermodesulfovibrionales bacterium]|nr:DUF2934 domain-containing protein [Thermodesulfovibrionales bacterium]HXY62264.1 DUF2934 domain-containing protein [Nitrospirota bacterium]
MKKNIDNLYDEIAKVAYELYEKSGSVHGRDEQHWLEAESIVLARYEKNTKKQPSSSRSATKKRK